MRDNWKVKWEPVMTTVTPEEIAHAGKSVANAASLIARIAGANDPAMFLWEPQPHHVVADGCNLAIVRDTAGGAAETLARVLAEVGVRTSHAGEEPVSEFFDFDLNGVLFRALLIAHEKWEYHVHIEII